MDYPEPDYPEPDWAAITKEQGPRLSEMHLRRYSNLFSKWHETPGGNPNIRINEVAKLLDIWKCIVEKKFDWEQLDEEERNELIDAISEEL